MDELQSYIQVLMSATAVAHKNAEHLQGAGFALVRVPSEKNLVRMLVPAVEEPLSTAAAVERFAVKVREALAPMDVAYAGIVCRVPLSLDGRPPRTFIVLYVDQKFGEMHVFLSPAVTGEPLKFEYQGCTLQGKSPLPSLIPPTTYGKPVEA